MISKDQIDRWAEMNVAARKCDQSNGWAESESCRAIRLLIAEIRALRKNQITPTGKCTTTHNACDCVLRELEALRKIKDAAKKLMQDYLGCYGHGDISDVDLSEMGWGPDCDPIKVAEAIQDYEREKGEPR